LEYQNDYLKQRPAENRRSITRIFYIVLVLTSVFLFFLIALICMDERQFAEKFLSGISYIVVSILSFLAGRKNRNQKDGKGVNNSIPDVVIEDNS